MNGPEIELTPDDKLTVVAEFPGYFEVGTFRGSTGDLKVSFVVDPNHKRDAYDAMDFPGEMMVIRVFRKKRRSKAQALADLGVSDYEHLDMPPGVGE